MLLVDLKTKMEYAEVYLCFNPEEIYDGENNTEKDIVELSHIGIRQVIITGSPRRASIALKLTI